MCVRESWIVTFKYRRRKFHFIDLATIIATTLTILSRTKFDWFFSLSLSLCLSLLLSSFLPISLFLSNSNQVQSSFKNAYCSSNECMREEKRKKKGRQDCLLIHLRTIREQTCWQSGNWTHYRSAMSAPIKPLCDHRAHSFFLDRTQNLAFIWFWLSLGTHVIWQTANLPKVNSPTVNLSKMFGPTNEREKEGDSLAMASSFSMIPVRLG